MTVNLSMLAGAGAQFFDNNGDPLSGGKIFTYAAGTTTPQATYTTSAGNVAHANPIVLDSAGRVPSGGEIWLAEDVSYKFVLANSAGTTIATYDNITGNGSGIVTALAASGGSSLVGFIQSGAGAVATTVQTKLRESVSVKDFGAVGDGVTDDWAAFQAALTSPATNIYVPPGTYYLTKALQLRKLMRIEGAAGFDAGFSPSILQFSNTTCGIVIHRNNTFCDDYGYNQSAGNVSLGDGGGSVIRHLTIRRGTGADTTIDGVTHGIRLRSRAHIDHCFVSGFAGNGIHIQASSGSSNLAQEGNANSWRISSARIQNCNHGVYVDGADVNAAMGIHVNSASNRGWGIWDSSFLGVTWIACHTSSNRTGSYKSDNLNARSVFIGCYSERDTPAADIISPALHIGGLSDVGNGNARSMRDSAAFVSDLPFEQEAGISAVTVSNFGSGYTSAPTVTFSAPTGTQATATLEISGGRIVAATITSGGGGYSQADYPTVTITGDGVGAIGKVTIESTGVVSAITITNEGSGYTTATATISAPTLVTAAATAVINSAGQVAYVVPTNPGSGYTSPPSISFSGGGGADAAATCVLKRGLSTFVGCNNAGNSEYTSVLNFNRDDVTTADVWRLKNFAYTGDIELDYRNIGQTFLITGAKTQQTFGQAFTVGSQWMSISNLVLSGQRRVSMQSTVPPTSGQYASGEIIFALNPSAGGSPGVVCTTSGVAGSTAVFKAMADLAA